ncbi:MAG: glycosyltransferase family 2 protein [Sphingomonadales bacterium]|nr:glycosyltransferase family 2 protein [Sphingomonadales bacterium]MDE2570495.1 glycosyltransferase family 2 protein [Sphingomonadales bacterium]
MTVAVVIASLGRPDLLSTLIERMESQSVRPDILLFSTVSTDDLPEGFAETDWIKSIQGPKGLTRQRNAALEYLGERYDVIVFYDDDFVPSLFGVENVRRFFGSHPDVAGATGLVLADGINGPGIDAAEALGIVAAHDAQAAPGDAIKADLVGLYGCNMAYRTSAIAGARFDERLRLYGWQEDIDFAMQLRQRGRIVRTDAFAGVHRGVKHGRTPGLRLGYSQVINPLYLAAKGTMPLAFAFRLLARNVIANHVRMLCPEPWVDRKGRARGNWTALFDVARGRLTPERIEQL